MAVYLTIPDQTCQSMAYGITHGNRTLLYMSSYTQFQFPHAAVPGVLDYSLSISQYILQPGVYYFSTLDIYTQMSIILDIGATTKTIDIKSSQSTLLSPIINHGCGFSSQNYANALSSAFPFYADIAAGNYSQVFDRGVLYYPFLTRYLYSHNTDNNPYHIEMNFTVEIYTASYISFLYLLNNRWTAIPVDQLTTPIIKDIDLNIADQHPVFMNFLTIPVFSFQRIGNI